MSWNQQWDGEPRDFSSPPDLIVYNEGTNDGGNITAQFVQVVKDLQGVAPKATQLLLLPFNGCHEADILGVVSEINSPNVVFGDTSGFYSGADGLHPFGYSHIADIAPKMAALCLPLLDVKKSKTTKPDDTHQRTFSPGECAAIATSSVESADEIVLKLASAK